MESLYYYYECYYSMSCCLVTACLTSPPTAMLWELFICHDKVDYGPLMCLCACVFATVPSEHTLFIRGDASSDQAGIIVFAGGLEHCQDLLHGNGNEHGLAGGYLSSVLWRCA